VTSKQTALVMLKRMICLPLGATSRGITPMAYSACLVSTVDSRADAGSNRFRLEKKLRAAKSWWESTASRCPVLVQTWGD
jgi:hypothetical protein